MKPNSSVPIAIILIVAAAVAYWYFFTGTEDQLSLIIDGSENQAQTRFQSLVVELTQVSFDTSIFSDPRFNALVDLTTPVAQEPTGRLDPFAVITNVSGN